MFSLLFQKNLAQIGTVDRGMANCTVGGVGIEPGVERWGHGMTAETEVRNALVSQHVLVGGAMDFVTSRASFDP
jgi:hypothetical protein